MLCGHWEREWCDEEKLTARVSSSQGTRLINQCLAIFAQKDPAVCEQALAKLPAGWARQSNHCISSDYCFSIKSPGNPSRVHYQSGGSGPCLWCGTDRLHFGQEVPARENTPTPTGKDISATIPKLFRFAAYGVAFEPLRPALDASGPFRLLRR